MAGPLYILALLALVSLAAADHAGWTYEGDTGPSHWGDVAAICGNGQKQSPINIPGDPEEGEDALKFNLTNFDTKTAGQKWQLINNGHTVQVNIPDEAGIETAGGGLEGTYLVKQFHFHWGSDDSQGSEHQVDGKKFPIEMHIVHYHDGVADPVNTEDGLAVLGVLFEISDDDNPKLNSVTDHLPEVRVDDATFQINSFELEDLLPENTDVYYRYSGSLTTPDCNQVVVWTLFKETVEISEAQLNKFRNLSGDGGHAISNNYRPVQDLHGRVVKLYDASSSTKYGISVSLLILSVLYSGITQPW